MLVLPRLSVDSPPWNTTSVPISGLESSASSSSSHVTDYALLCRAFVWQCRSFSPSVFAFFCELSSSSVFLFIELQVGLPSTSRCANQLLGKRVASLELLYQGIWLVVPMCVHAFVTTHLSAMQSAWTVLHSCILCQNLNDVQASFL